VRALGFANIVDELLSKAADSKPMSEKSHDWDYEVKPARTMCHGKSGLDAPSPFVIQAGRVKPAERECRNPKSDRKRSSLASSRHQILLPECECDCVARQQPMEERLPHFLIGVLVVPSRIV
jgi:hypothetical protein